jgi:hypothetical protein
MLVIYASEKHCVCMRSERLLEGISGHASLDPNSKQRLITHGIFHNFLCRGSKQKHSIRTTYAHMTRQNEKTSFCPRKTSKTPSQRKKGNLVSPNRLKKTVPEVIAGWLGTLRKSAQEMKRSSGREKKIKQSRLGNQWGELERDSISRHRTWHVAPAAKEEVIHARVTVTSLGKCRVWIYGESST